MDIVPYPPRCFSPWNRLFVVGQADQVVATDANRFPSLDKVLVVPCCTDPSGWLRMSRASASCAVEGDSAKRWRPGLGDHCTRHRQESNRPPLQDCCCQRHCPSVWDTLDTTQRQKRRSSYESAASRISGCTLNAPRCVLPLGQEAGPVIPGAIGTAAGFGSHAAPQMSEVFRMGTLQSRCKKMPARNNYRNSAGWILLLYEHRTLAK